MSQSVGKRIENDGSVSVAPCLQFVRICIFPFPPTLGGFRLSHRQPGRGE